MQWSLLLVSVALASVAAVQYEDDPIVQNFREYIRINTTTGADLTPALNFWKRLAAEAGLPVNVYEFKKGFPVMVIKLAGADNSLPSVMLNSHIDVVPADDEDEWAFPPFSAHLTENGDIYGRGTQDTKALSIMHFEAMRALKAQNVPLLRNVYLTLMPDEEDGGQDGMVRFLESEEFAAMNVGVEFDEGVAYPLPIVPIFIQNKVPWQVQIECLGDAAHGSTFPHTSTTAVGKCLSVINSLYQFRDEQFEVYQRANVFDAGAYSSVNLNVLNGGATGNVIPNRVTLLFDIRLSTTLSEKRLQAQLEQWVAEAGTNITISYLLRDAQSPATVTNSSNPYWTALLQGVQDAGVATMPLVLPGSTDARYVRRAGIPSFELTPLPDTPSLPHSRDERITASSLLRGVDIFTHIVRNVANISAGKTAGNNKYVVSTVVED